MTQTIVNLGTGGALLNGQNGSTTGADSNDALYLDWSGLNYVYLPGVAGNFLSVPDAAALDITGDIDIRVQVALDDWTPAAQHTLLSKGSANSQTAYRLGINFTTGLVNFTAADQATSTAVSVNSTVAPTIADGAVKWIRVTRGVAAGEVKFFTSDDGVAFTQLGTTVAFTTAVPWSNSVNVEVGSRTSGVNEVIAGKVYRAQVFNGIGGAKVLDVDTSVLTTGAATSFTALTGQTVTINRSTAGRKTVAVVSPVWLFGTDDAMQVTSNDLLNFGAVDSFSVLAISRVWNTPTNFGVLIRKRNPTAGQPGYVIQNNGTALQLQMGVGEGANSATDFPFYSQGTLNVLAMTVNRGANQLTSYVNGTAASPISTSLVGSLSSLDPLMIGARFPLGNHFDMELLAVAVFRRALTATEISQLTAYYQARLS